MDGEITFPTEVVNTSELAMRGHSGVRHTDFWLPETTCVVIRMAQLPDWLHPLQTAPVPE